MNFDIENQQKIIVDSSQRASGSNSNFEIILPLDTTKEYDSICLLQASIPKSYYLIPDGYNTFTLQEGAQTATVTITPGNYNISSFMTVLSASMISASPLGATYAISYPNVNSAADTGKITITTNNAVATSIIFGDSYGLNIQMGFERNSTNTFTAQSLTSANVVNLQPNKVLYICCDAIADKSNNVIQEIFNTYTPTMSAITFQTTDIAAWTKDYTAKNTNKFNFYVLNEYNQIIDFNGLSWVCTLLFYKRSRIMKKMETYIKYKAQLDDK